MAIFLDEANCFFHIRCVLVKQKYCLPLICGVLLLTSFKESAVENPLPIYYKDIRSCFWLQIFISIYEAPPFLIKSSLVLWFAFHVNVFLLQGNGIWWYCFRILVKVGSLWYLAWSRHAEFGEHLFCLILSDAFYTSRAIIWISTWNSWTKLWSFLPLLIFLDFRRSSDVWLSDSLPKWNMEHLL